MFKKASGKKNLVGLDIGSSAVKAVELGKKGAGLQLLNLGFEKARELLPFIKSPQWLQAWSISLGILIDKRRLEDGEATSRTRPATTSTNGQVKHP